MQESRKDLQIEIPDEIRKLLDKSPPELRAFVNLLLERINSLEAHLKLYENPHVPSSKRVIKEVKIVKKPKKRGAPKGHRGATRERPAPDRVVELKPNSCPMPECGSKKIRVLKKFTKPVEDIIIIRITTKFIYYGCLCEDCGTQFVTGCEELPKKGNFGPNLSSLWTALHYIGTIPFKRLATFPKRFSPR